MRIIAIKFPTAKARNQLKIMAFAEAKLTLTASPTRAAGFSVVDISNS